jgi:hypothetical protein
MRPLGFIYLLFGLWNVCYGQELGCDGKALGVGEPCAPGVRLLAETPTLLKVPHCDRLYRVASSTAVPQSAVPCEGRMPSPMPTLAAAGRSAVGSPLNSGDDRLGHLLEAVEHLMAAGETGEARKVQQLVAEECQKLTTWRKALEAEVAQLRRRNDQPAQILVELKLVELSRTKLRALGFDFAKLHGEDVRPAAYEPFRFQVVDGTPPILRMLRALQNQDIAKTLAEPTLVTVSGRPAAFHVGGEVPAVVTQADGSQKVESREYGTRVDVVAIALGEGKIRLELRPSISELDSANSVAGNPAIKVREMDTGVELESGQTVVIRGMVQDRVEASNVGIPWWANDVPYLGRLFSTVEEHSEETELILLAKAELVEAMDDRGDSQARPVGLGLRTISPEDRQLFFRQDREASTCCPDDCCLPSPSVLPAPSSARVAPAPTTTK